LQHIVAGVAAGAPAGAVATCAGQATVDPAQPEPWPTNCDATYQVLAHATSGESAAFLVPAGQEIHPKIAVQAPWGSEAMQGIAFRPITNNAKVLHHWILYGPQKEFLVGWAPGKDNTPLPADVGMNLSGGALTLDMHYNNLPGTVEESDQSGVEICALTKEHFRKYTASVHMGFTQLLFSIPARATDYEVKGQCTVTSATPVTLISASPHAHTLATHMRFEVQKSGGERIMMHDADFRFEEQQSYALATPVVLEKGDTVFTTCTYTNTSARAVTFGEDTGNEMCFNFASYYPMGGLKCGLQYGSR
ncbi:MAG: hypothetical protein RL701_7671, partial [Pseudomonadota bacterium]